MAVGGLNKAKGRRSAKRAQKGMAAQKRRNTIRNKERRLKKHVISHPDDKSGTIALKKWKAAY